jgi:hypothetical protein
MYEPNDVEPQQVSADALFVDRRQAVAGRSREKHVARHQVWVERGPAPARSCRPLCCRHF